MPIHAAVIQKLLSTNAHVGRRLAAPHIKPYLHGTRNSLSIVDADKTLITLRAALGFISHLARTRFQAHSNTRPARFLFVNTNPLYDHIFDHMTRITGFGSYLSPRAQFWRQGGFLTNPYSPKRFRGRNKRLCFAPVDLPDCVVVVDPDLKCSVIDEACRVGVPVVALVDSSTPRSVFEKIAYPVVCGSESVQFVYMMCNLITKTFLLEKKLAGADGGADVDDHLVDSLKDVHISRDDSSEDEDVSRDDSSEDEDVSRDDSSEDEDEDDDKVKQAMPKDLNEEKKEDKEKEEIKVDKENEEMKTDPSSA